MTQVYSAPHSPGSFEPDRRAILRLALALAWGLPASVRAEQPEIDVRSDAVRQIHIICTQARGLLGQGRAMQALNLLKKANELIEEAPETRWPWRLRVGPDLGFALLELGQPDAARIVLEQVLTLESRARKENLLPFVKILNNHDTGIGGMMIKVELKRQLMSAVVADGVGPHSLDDLVWDTSVGTSETLLNLGRALLACGRPDQLTSLYRESVLQRGGAEDNLFSRYAVELRHFKFGVLLAQAGVTDWAYRAFRQALVMNFDRIRESAANVASPTAIYGGIGVGQRMLSVSVGHAIAMGQDTLKENATELIATMLQYKALGTRYAGWLNHVLHAGPGPDRTSAVAEIDRLEDELAGLPVDQFAVAALHRLDAQKTMVLLQIFPALSKEGLKDVVLDGSDILGKVRKNLGSDVAIAFLVYTPMGRLNGRAFKPEPQRYLRYCITATSIDIQDIGAVSDIDSAVFSFRRDLLLGEEGRAGGAALFRLLLGSAPEAVSIASRWVVDPDGALALLPFEALRDSHDRPVLERHQVRYVSSLAQMIERSYTKPAIGAVCIVSNPAYPRLSEGQSPLSSGGLTEGDLRSGLLAIPPLPETGQEADAVAKEMQALGWAVSRAEDRAATAQYLLELQHAPRVLHMACHAVLLESGVSTEVAARAQTFKGDTLLDMVLPGRRAALILAGDKTPSILLAKDFSRLPLQGTQLAVLSACDTGNGDIELGEGVSGLRRALEQAGVASSVTSLWPVPSKATAILMASFYEHLGQGLRKSHALQLAKLALMRSGASPHAWAGFLLAGSDDAMNG